MKDLLMPWIIGLFIVGIPLWIYLIGTFDPYSGRSKGVRIPHLPTNWKDITW